MEKQPLSVKAVFDRAFEIDCPGERAAYLDEACAGAPELRQKVMALLKAHADAGSFLESPLAPLSAAAYEPLTERPGTVIGPYKLLEQIGEGGFGIVFMAEQQQPVRRKVALKVLKPGMDTRQVVARFEAERQALALMDHPNIANILDGGATPTGRPYFVMELVRGIPITDFCDQNQLPIRERLGLFLGVCQAVQHAHTKGVIHRDLKPSNVLVTLHDGTPVAKVIDFGTAKATGQQLTDKTLFTGFAQMIGTPLYMAPEQAALSNVDADTRSDIYSLGVLLYQLLTGTTPFEKDRLRGADYDEIRRIIREEEPPRPSTRLSTLGQAATTLSTQRKTDPRRLRQLVRGELDWIVMKAQEKDRNRRYETASAFAADVQRHLNGEPVQACPASAWYRFRKFARRNRRALSAVALVMLALGGGSVASTWQAIRANRAEKDAVGQRDLARQAERLANEERDKARRAEMKTEAINQYLVQNLLTFSRPGRFGYRETDTTVAQVLEEASRDVETAFPGQPELEASVRLTIGNTFFRLGKFKEAERHLRKGLNLQGDLLSTSTDPWGREYAETAFATKRLGLALQALGRKEEAKAFVVRGGEARRRIEIRRIPFKVNAFPFSLHPLNVVLSPDGHWLLASGDDRCLRLYDVATGMEIHRLVGHGLPLGLAFSPDGRHALSGSDDKTVRLWDVFTAKELCTFTGHTDFVKCVAFSPDGRHALSGGGDKTIRLWDIQSGKELRKLVGHAAIIHQASFSPDGSRILSSSTDGTIRLWETATGAEIRCFPKAWTVVTTIVFSPDGRRALSTHEDGSRLWDLETGTEIRRIRNAAGIGPTVFTPDGHHAVCSGDTRGKWCLFDLDTGKEVRSYHVEAPLRSKQICVSPDGRLAVCGNFRGSISIWRLGEPPPMGQELAAARQYYDQKCRARGPAAPGTLQALDELAALHLDRDEPADAEPLFRQSLASKKRLLGVEHPATLGAMKNLARVLQAQKKMPEAAALWRECLEVYRRVEGPDHADVMVAMNDLADVLDAQGKQDEADVLWQQCMHGWERLLGHNECETLAAASKLVLKLQAHGKPVEPKVLGLPVGYVYAQMAQWDKALSGYAKAFKLEMQKHPGLCFDYACLLVEGGDTDGYRKLCGKLLERFVQSKNVEDIDWLAQTFVLAPQALPDTGRILELAQRRIARASPGCPWAIHVLALAFYRAGRFDKTVECLSGSLKDIPEGQHDVANWLVMAMAEQRLGHHERALGWFDKGDRWIVERTVRIRCQGQSLAASGFGWQHWLMMQVLHREGKALIRGNIADQQPEEKRHNADSEAQP
jgi:serine/threonine protein kinase/WD40 repeat protein